MKKLCCLFLVVLSGQLLTMASPGDTTRVISHNKVVIKTNPSRGHTIYPSWVKFPSVFVPMRKIYLNLKFECAPGLKCGEWDYLNFIYLGKAGGIQGDSLGYELGRFITPYGFYWDASSGWSHSWLMDMTDFQAILKDSVEIYYMHTGYEANHDRGWQITLEWVFVEGTPNRDVYKIQQLHNKSFAFGNPSLKPVKASLKNDTISLHPSATAMRLRITQSGHGSDGQEGCAEFCSKKRLLKLDGNLVSEKAVWRDNCGLNSLYPQAGTWIYDRSNWCPGSPVYPFHYQTDAAPGSHVIDIDMESYSAPSESNYVISTYLFHCGPFNFNTDIELDEIISPSDYPDHKRENPACGMPKVKITNNGKNQINSVHFRYGKRGNLKSDYVWTGQLKSMESTVVELMITPDWRGLENIFEVNVIAVNGAADDYVLNNKLESKYALTPVHPPSLFIYFRTNNAASENYYRVTDGLGRVISEKNMFNNNLVYRDTLGLGNGDCYKLEFWDDGTPPSAVPLNKDGLNWWGNTADGAGFVQLRNSLTGATVKSLPTDFGTNFIYTFTTAYTMDMEETEPPFSFISIYPNPTSRELNLDIEISGSEQLDIQFFSIKGESMNADIFSNTNIFTGSVQTSQWPSGIYTMRIKSGNTVICRKISVIH